MMISISQLPALNAILNTLATILLLCGYKAIKSGEINRHRKFMLSAFTVSTLFLCSYITYHYLHPVTKYHREGILKVIYYFILITHIPLAILVVPFCLLALWFAYQKRFDKHTMVTKRLFPVWLYVSVTGVIIYLMLYIF